jgi:hypothetical protein
MAEVIAKIALAAILNLALLLSLKSIVIRLVSRGDIKLFNKA